MTRHKRNSKINFKPVAVWHEELYVRTGNYSPVFVIMEILWYKNEIAPNNLSVKEKDMLHGARMQQESGEKSSL